MTPDLLTYLLGAVASFVALLSLTYAQWAIYRLRRKYEGRETTEQRVARFTKALSDSARIIDEMEQEIGERQKTAEKLRGEIETYNKLKDLNREEVEAVSQALGGELRREGRRSFWVGLAMNTVFFLLGVGATVLLSSVFGF